MDQARLNRAKELRLQADVLEQEAARPLPENWEIGMRVRFIRSSEWAFSKGDEAVVTKLREECSDRKGYEYQVFFTSPDNGEASWWTTPDDVELVI